MRRFVVLSLFIVGCAEPSVGNSPGRFSTCTCEDEKLAEWILQCVEKANDESAAPALVLQCEETGVHLLCEDGCFVSGQGIIRRNDRESDYR